MRHRPAEMHRNTHVVPGSTSTASLPPLAFGLHMPEHARDECLHTRENVRIAAYLAPVGAACVLRFCSRRSQATRGWTRSPPARDVRAVLCPIRDRSCVGDIRVRAGCVRSGAFSAASC
jgi:hypothetical protein